MLMLNVSHLRNNILLLSNTFVSFDMLFNSQNEYKEDLKESLLKYRTEIQ